jgi:transcriptional regulator NrdR family protein
MVITGRPYKCPYCGSTETHWKGYRARADGWVRLRKCTSCGKKFTSRRVVGEVEDEGNETPEDS